MPKPNSPARSTTQRPKPNTAATTVPAGTELPRQPAPIKLSSGDAKLMAAVLMEMLNR